MHAFRCENQNDASSIRKHASWPSAGKLSAGARSRGEARQMPSFTERQDGAELREVRGHPYSLLWRNFRRSGGT